MKHSTNQNQLPNHRRTLIQASLGVFGSLNLFGLSACGGGGESTASAVVVPNVTAQFSKRGFTVPGFSIRTLSALDTSLRAAVDSGANTVIIDYHLVQPGGLRGNAVIEDFPLDKLIQAVIAAKSLGLTVWVKPIVIVGGYSDPDLTNWQRLAPTDPAAWFASYTAQLIALVGKSGASNIDAVLLGNELYSMTTNSSYRQYWLDLIGRIRNLFRGSIGYNAGGLMGRWDTSQEFSNITFLAQLDFIGISTYPRLSSKFNANIDDYRAGWTSNIYGENLLSILNNFIASTTKEVYLTELGSPALQGGIQSLTGAAPPVYDLAQHASFYAASLDVLMSSTGGRLKGVFIYNWHANIGSNDGFVATADRYGPYTWNVYGKPAQEEIRKKFNIRV